MSQRPLTCPPLTSAGPAGARSSTNFFSNRKLVTTHFLRRKRECEKSDDLDLRDHLGGPVHGVAGQPGGDHGAAIDTRSSALLAGGAAMDGERIHADLRGAAADGCGAW